MAQIQIEGFVAAEIQQKLSLKKNVYVCFPLKEYLGKGRWQTYQVWAWGDIPARMERLSIKEGSRIWLTGSLELVDCTANQGREKTKLLKVYCSNFGLIPRHKTGRQNADIGIAASVESQTTPEVIDGDRMQLPE